MFRYDSHGFCGQNAEKKRTFGGLSSSSRQKNTIGGAACYIFFFATVLGDLPALQDLNQVSHLGVGSVLFDQVAASDGPGGYTRGSAG